MTDEFQDIGPYCKDWFSTGEPSFCVLNGGTDGKFCPGAIQIPNRGHYVTTHPGVCNKTIGRYLIVGSKAYQENH